MSSPTTIHLIAAGGRVMGDLADFLTAEGHRVTKSDDTWHPERLTPATEIVIIGSRTSTDNPELLRARELHLNILSFPDYVYTRAMQKQRLVVTGTLGRTMITSLILHVLQFHRRSFDYVVGTPPAGFQRTVRLSDAPLIVIESHDAPASPLDSTPVFLKYHHHIGVISGIQWQQSDQSLGNEEEYIRKFDQFEAATPKGGVLVYSELDPVVTALSNMERPDVLFVPFKTHASATEGGQELLVTGNKDRLPIHIFGKANLQYISAAKETLKRIGVTSDQFYQAISSFTGIPS